MHHPWILARLLCAMFVCLTLASPAEAKGATYSTGFTRWRSADGGLATWTRHAGVVLGSGGTLQLDPATATPGADPYPPGGYNGGNFYNGGSFLVGETDSPIVAPSFAFTEAIASWNADTPPGTRIETQISA